MFTFIFTFEISKRKEMKTLTQIIAKSRSKVMRTAWHLHRVTGISFSECLKKAWEIIKDAFNKIELQKGRCFLENKKNVYRMIDKPIKDVNREMIDNVVFLTNFFKNQFRIIERKKANDP